MLVSRFALLEERICQSMGLVARRQLSVYRVDFQPLSTSSLGHRGLDLPPPRRSNSRLQSVPAKMGRELYP